MSGPAEATLYEGGCLCGDVRYRVQGPPISAPYCHCSMCRRAAGAPVVAWGTFATKGFTFTRGKPARYASSPLATRQFCGRCGSPLIFQYNDRPDELDVTLATLDAPERLAPDAHLYEADRIPWLVLGDALPRFPRTRQG